MSRKEEDYLRIASLHEEKREKMIIRISQALVFFTVEGAIFMVGGTILVFFSRPIGITFFLIGMIMLGVVAYAFEKGEF